MLSAKHLVVGALCFLLAARGIVAAMPEDGLALTVCEVLSDLDRYEGKSIIVVGRFSWTDEGSWLSEDCKLEIVRGGREFSDPQISIAWDRRLLEQKVAQLKRTTKLRKYRPSKYNEKWVAVFGRLESRLPRQMQPATPLPNGWSATTNGFGHLSGSPAQLIPATGGFLTIQ